MRAERAPLPQSARKDLRVPFVAMRYSAHLRASEFPTVACHTRAVISPRRTRAYSPFVRDGTGCGTAATAVDPIAGAAASSIPARIRARRTFPRKREQSERLTRNRCREGAPHSLAYGNRISRIANTLLIVKLR